jgi:predicted GIY-YIG superfamily endonuclease
MKLSPSQAKVVYKYKNLKLKVLKTAQNIIFNNECLKNQVIPNYICIKTNTRSAAANKAKTTAELVWLKTELKQQHRKKSMLNKLLLMSHITMLNEIHPAQITSILSKIESQIAKEISLKKRTQKKKLETLLNKKHNIDIGKINHKFYPRTINLSDVVFDDDEMKLLNKGLKYNLVNNGRKHLFSEIINAEASIQTLPDVNAQNTARVMINQKINSLTKNHKTKRHNFNESKILKRIQNKVINNNLYITKADKGNTLVIMKNTDYTDKVKDFIIKNNIDKLNKDPTATYTKEINKAISNCKHLLSANDIRYLKPIHPHAPPLKGLPKLHKDNTPIRPLVNYMPAPAYRLAKKLESIIKKEVKLHNSHSLKNSLELIETIKNTELNPRYTLASLDITNLYTNVPVTETINILQDNLEKHSNLNECERKELLTLLRLVLKQNYFCFNNEYYLQTEGLAMGSPLSGILAEIFLNDFENKFIWAEANRYKSKLIFFYRYVDDIVILYDGNPRQVTLFNNFINSIHPKLKFTLEFEQDNRLNFLDLTLNKNSDRFSFKIYRKPTATDTTIHATSHHPMSQKLAAYSSFVHRLLTVPLSQQDFNEEKTILKHVAIANGYSPNIIESLIKKQLKKKNNLMPTEPKPKMDYVSVEFGNNFPLTLKNEMKKHGKVVAFRTNNKLGNLLNTKNNTVDFTKRTGVYQLKCTDCSKFYIGQTGRPFEKRFKEHLPKANGQQISNFADHLINENHNYSNINTNLQPLHFCSKGRKLTVLESYEIFKANKTSPDDLLNDKCTMQQNILFETLLKLDNR